MGRDLTTTFIGNGEPTFHRNSFQRRPPSTAQLSSPSRFLAAFAAATQEWILLWRKEGLLPNYVIKKKEKKGGHKAIYFRWRHDWMRCWWLPTAALTLSQPLLPWLRRWCEELIVQGRTGDLQEAVHGSLRRAGTTLRHTRCTHRRVLTAAEKTSAFISCTWCIAKPKKKKGKS